MPARRGDDGDVGALAAADAAYRTLECARWPDGPRCAHCGAGDVTFLAPTGGRRYTRTGSITPRRVWRCATCHRQFSVLTATLLHGTRIDLGVWLAVVTTMAAERAVPTAERIRHEHAVSRDAARHLYRLLRAAGEVEAVAACLGGDG